MSLTPRQRDIARLVNDGLTDKAIAREIGVSKRTVHNHISQIAAKINGPSDIPARRRVMLWFRLNGEEAA